MALYSMPHPAGSGGKALRSCCEDSRFRTHVPQNQQPLPIPPPLNNPEAVHKRARTWMRNIKCALIAKNTTNVNKPSSTIKSQYLHNTVVQPTSICVYLGCICVVGLYRLQSSHKTHIFMLSNKVAVCFHHTSSRLF